MKTNWTRADELRSRKMGWVLARGVNRIWAFDDTFKSDAEAIEWVCANSFFGLGTPRKATGNWPDTLTCRKAIFLCCKGGVR